MIWGEKTESKSGLYLLEPYDPNRIPVVFVHGLLSSGYTWLNVSNAVRADPEIRRRYQVWVFFFRPEIRFSIPHCDCGKI
jgi:pimeloyl-ACP methyl ester carboxylesterase